MNTVITNVEHLVINEDANEVDFLFLNDDITLIELYPNIYEIVNTNWILKIYKNFKYFKNERDSLIKLQNIKGVSKLISYSKTGCNIKYIILEKENGKELFEYKYKFDIDEIKKITKGILLILKDIHEKDIIHKDIKPENILYDRKTGNITIIDFEGKMTTEYMSPEQFIKSPSITTKTDLWSLGVLIYGLVFDEFPFTIEDIFKFDYKLAFPFKIDSKLEFFLQCLIEPDSNLRYSAQNILSCEWLNN